MLIYDKKGVLCMTKKKQKFAKIVDFMKEIDKFKMVDRKIHVSSLKRYENDAEHSWHLAMLIILLEKDLPKNLDLMKMVKMAFVHDLGELYVGDVSFFDTKGREGKDKRELASAKKLFAKLPKKLEREMLSLFIEYSKSKTKEAKFVKSLDKLQAGIQTISTKGKNLKDLGLTYDHVDSKKRPYMEHDKKILSFYEHIMNDTKNKGLFSKS